jgi:adenosine deaminase
VHAALVARDELNLPIVGLDIAGAEAGYPCSHYKEAFDLAHRNFLQVV